MKVRIVKTIAPHVRYTDADTGLLDAGNKQASEPIRILPAPEREPPPPTDADVNAALPSGSHLDALRTILAYPADHRRAVETVSSDLNIDEKTALSLVQRGLRDVLKYYADAKRAELRARWEEKRAAWEETERLRQESLRFWVSGTRWWRWTDGKLRAAKRS